MPPLWIIAIYGFIERVVMILLILGIANIKINKINKMKIIIISIISVSITLLCKYNLEYYTFIAILNALFTGFCVKLFYKYSNLNKILLGTIISFLIVLICENIFGYIAITYFMYINYYILWIASGIPHIIVMLLITYMIRNYNNEKTILFKN